MGLALSVTTALLALGSFALILTMMRSSSKAAKEAVHRVWSEGVPASATVVSATPNGSHRNHPRLLLHLELSETGRPARRAQVTQVIARPMVERFAPGEEIDVRVDPKDPATVVVDPALTPYAY